MEKVNIEEKVKIKLARAVKIVCARIKRTDEAQLLNLVVAAMRELNERGFSATVEKACKLQAGSSIAAFCDNTYADGVKDTYRISGTASYAAYHRLVSKRTLGVWNVLQLVEPLFKRSNNDSTRTV